MSWTMSRQLASEFQAWSKVLVFRTEISVPAMQHDIEDSLPQGKGNSSQYGVLYFFCFTFAMLLYNLLYAYLIVQPPQPSYQ